MKKLEETLPYLALMLSSGIALSFYGYLGSFTRFIADDYCSATYAQERGFLRSIWYWYHTWSGRYSAFGMDWLVLTKLIDRYSIQIVPPLTLAIWFVFASATIFLYLKSIDSQMSNLIPAIALAASAIYVILVLSPNISQSLYWWNGIRSYTLPLVVLTGYTYFFQIISKRFHTTNQLVFWGTTSFLLLFASAGLSETYAVLQFVLLIFLLGLKMITIPRKKLDTEASLLLAGLLGNILALIVIISAPGNAIRQSRLDASFDLTNLVAISLSGYAEFFINLFNQANKFTALLGIVFVVISLGFRHQDAKVAPWKFYAFFIGIFVFSFACILPGVYGYSQLPPERTLILPIFILIIFLLQASFIAGSWLSNKINLSAWNINGLITLACALMIFSTTLTSISLYERRDTYIAFAQKWDQVDAQILQAKAEGKETVNIPSMSNWSGLDVPNQDPGFWLNECYTDLYGIEVLGPPFEWE